MKNVKENSREAKRKFTSKSQKKLFHESLTLTYMIQISENAEKIREIPKEHLTQKIILAAIMKNPKNIAYVPSDLVNESLMLGIICAIPSRINELPEKYRFKAVNVLNSVA